MSFSDNFIRIMDAIGEKLGIAIDWTNQNMMPYLEQLTQKIVKYEISMSAFWIIVFCILLIIGIVIVVKNNKKLAYDDFYILPALLGWAIIFVVLVGLGLNITKIITAMTLPEKTIIEFIMQYK